MSNVLYVQNLEKQIAGQKQLVAEQNRLNKERQEWALHTNGVIADLKQTIEHQAAQIEMMREALTLIALDDCCTDPAPIAQKALSSAPDQALERFAVKVREQCAQMLLDGSFLHDQSPAKLLAIEAAKAIRAITELPK